jgi:inner membrane transporter RhtA
MPNAVASPAGARRRARTGAALIVGCSLTIQLGGALAHGLFDQLGPLGTSSLRFALGALILLVAIRPSPRGRDAPTWLAVGAYGLAVAALNVCFFAAIDRIEMGIAVTFAFVAPLAMALVRSRRRRDVALALLAVGGVALLGGVDRPSSMAGVALSLACGVAWVVVAFAARRVGASTARIDGLALALPVAAVVTLPFGIAQAGAIDVRAVALGVVIAVVGLVVPFALELEGLRRLEPRAVAIVYSVDPAIAALVGLVALGEGLSAAQALGIVAVMGASIGVATEGG